MVPSSSACANLTVTVTVTVTVTMNVMVIAVHPGAVNGAPIPAVSATQWITTTTAAPAGGSRRGASR